MIPREILKKIRQIELRTNRIVTEFAAGARASARFTARLPAASKTNPALNFIRTLKRRERRAPDASFQSSPQLGGVLVSLPDSNYLQQPLLFQDRKENRVRPADDFGFVSGWPGFGITKWIGNYLLKIFIKHHGEASADSGFARLIPIARLTHFFSDIGLNDETKAHCLTPYRANISARRVSQGMPRPGFARASAARRSSSAICSGVSLSSNSTNSFSMCSTNSRRSASGIRRISSRISVALMALKLTAIKYFASA